MGILFSLSPPLDVFMDVLCFVWFVLEPVMVRPSPLENFEWLALGCGFLSMFERSQIIGPRFNMSIQFWSKPDLRVLRRLSRFRV